MKPVPQTLFGEDNGNCLQAVIASVLELRLEQVPDFANEYGDDDWYEKLNEWLERWYGMWLVFTDLKVKPAGYHLMCTSAYRSEVPHVVVGLDGAQVHDPYPGGGTVVVEVYGLFVNKLDSRRARKPVETPPQRGTI